MKSAFFGILAGVALIVALVNVNQSEWTDVVIAAFFFLFFTANSVAAARS